MSRTDMGGDRFLSAAVFAAARTMEVREVPTPSPDPGEVLIRVDYCGICGSDLSVWEGGALSGPDVVLGHDGPTEGQTMGPKGSSCSTVSSRGLTSSSMARKVMATTTRSVRSASLSPLRGNETMT